MTGRHLSRRRMLAVLGAGTALTAIGAFVSLEGDTGTPSSDETEDAVRTVGRRYLENRADTPSVETLLAELPLAVRSPISENGATGDDLSDARAVIRAEYAADGELESVDGWLWSPTEVRLAALVSLTD